MRSTLRLRAAVAAMAALALGAASPLRAQRPVDVAPNAPADQPVSATLACQLTAMVRATAPYVETARATFPAARVRFLGGLPPRHTFFVTTRLRDGRGRPEQVFVAVDSMRGGEILGRIWSQIGVVAGYRFGQPYAFPEAELVDWMIARPDGTEEGNVVGKFLDTYRPPAACADSGHAG